MKITLNHSASSYGVPVILDDHGELMDYSKGLTATLKKLGLSREDVAILAGYKSRRSIDKFWQGVPPSAQLLNVLMVELQQREHAN